MTPRDPIREALVSARTRAWMAYVDGPPPGYEAVPGFRAQALGHDYDVAAKAVADYDRFTPAASSDAGALDTPTEGNL